MLVHLTTTTATSRAVSSAAIARFGAARAEASAGGGGIEGGGGGARPVLGRTPVQSHPPPAEWYERQTLRARGHRSLHLSAAADMLGTAARRMRDTLPERRAFENALADLAAAGWCVLSRDGAAAHFVDGAVARATADGRPAGDGIAAAAAAASTLPHAALTTPPAPLHTGAGATPPCPSALPFLASTSGGGEQPHDAVVAAAAARLPPLPHVVALSPRTTPAVAAAAADMAGLAVYAPLLPVADVAAPYVTPGAPRYGGMTAAATSALAAARGVAPAGPTGGGALSTLLPLAVGPLEALTVWVAGTDTTAEEVVCLPAAAGRAAAAAPPSTAGAVLGAAIAELAWDGGHERDCGSGHAAAVAGVANALLLRLAWRQAHATAVVAGGAGGTAPVGADPGDLGSALLAAARRLAAAAGRLHPDDLVCTAVLRGDTITFTPPGSTGASTPLLRLRVPAT